jgi:hypothetical protein
METTVKTTLKSLLSSSTTSPVTVKGSRKKYATATQISEHAKKSGISLTSGWAGRIATSLAANGGLSMTTTVHNGKTTTVYGLK